MSIPSIISYGLILLIPAGFALRVFLHVQGWTLFLMITFAAICVITFSCMHKMLPGKKSQSVVAYLQPMIIFPSIYLANFGLEDSSNDPIQAILIALAVTAFASGCFVLGLHVGRREM